MKRLHRRTGTISAMMLGLSVVAVVAAGPAAAAKSDCPSGYFCIWRDANYATSSDGDALVQFFNYIPNYGLWTYDGTTIGAANTATSLYNRSSGGNDARIYKNANGGGDGYTIGPGSSRSNLATSLAPTGFNDEIESAYFCTSDPNC